jgi:hypothetical protein
MRIMCHAREEAEVAPRHCVVLINGNSRTIDLLGHRHERDLPLVAEGCTTARMAPAHRARVGRGFVDMALRGRHTNQEGCMVLRGVTRTKYYYQPYDYDCASSPRLHARLSITEDLLVAWNFNEIAPEVLLEELHTACELTLEELVNKRSKKVSLLTWSKPPSKPASYSPLPTGHLPLNSSPNSKTYEKKSAIEPPEEPMRG